MLGLYKGDGFPPIREHVEVPCGNTCRAVVLLLSQFESDIFCARGQGTGLICMLGALGNEGLKCSKSYLV